MIVLQRVDPVEGRAEFSVVSGTAMEIREEFARAAEAARQVGLRELRLRLSDSSRSVEELQAYVGDLASWKDNTGLGVDLGQSWDTPAATALLASTQLTCRVDGTRVIYDVELDQGVPSINLVAMYSALILATYGPQENHLTQLRIALYEICANVLEHGHPLSDEAKLHLQLTLADGRIEGVIQDSCEEFDPSAQELVHISERVAARYRRGYGITMILQLLDGFSHEYNETGNRMSFVKEIDA